MPAVTAPMDLCAGREANPMRKNFSSNERRDKYANAIAMLLPATKRSNMAAAGFPAEHSASNWRENNISAHL